MVADYTAEIGLQFEDIIILELFPMLTDEWLESHPQERDEVIRELFKLTVDFIREFEPSVILSCQCFGASQYWRWGAFSDAVAAELRSSMIGAEKLTVSGFYVDNHWTHVVHGFHPAKLFYEQGKESQRLEKIRKGSAEDFRLCLQSLRPLASIPIGGKSWPGNRIHQSPDQRAA